MLHKSIRKITTICLSVLLSAVMLFSFTISSSATTYVDYYYLSGTLYDTLNHSALAYYENTIQRLTSGICGYSMDIFPPASSIYGQQDCYIYAVNNDDSIVYLVYEEYDDYSNSMNVHDSSLFYPTVSVQYDFYSHTNVITNLGGHAYLYSHGNLVLMTNTYLSMNISSEIN